MRMPNIVDFNHPKDKVIDKVYKYFIFTISISWLPIISNYFYSIFFGVGGKKLILYKSEICIMTIILVANNIIDLSESSVLRRGGLFRKILYTLNAINIFFSTLFFAGSNVIELLSINHLEPEIKQFWFVLGTYIAAAFMGLSVQIAAGVDEIKHTNRRRR